MRGILLPALFVAAVTWPDRSPAAEDGGKFDGALWRYSATRVMGNDVREGAFRISGKEMFQPHEGKPTVVGTIDEKKFLPKKGDKIPVTFTRLRSKGGEVLALKGRIEWIELGEVRGRLIDSDGAHWNFRATRFQE